MSVTLTLKPPAEVDVALRNALWPGMLYLGQEMEALARTLCPVDTGRLRDSIQVIVGDVGRFVLHAGMPYAKYVEYGTIHHTANPFMRLTMDEIAPIALELIATGVAAR